MKRAYSALILAALPAAMMAQSAIDAMQISQPDFKGSARYMSMGGAFTALGGELSSITHNPAGIGVYRSSEVGVTVDINMQNSSTTRLSYDFPTTQSQTKVYCNNFGYVGATRLDGAMRTFNWGVTYNRAASFDRVYRGYVPSTSTSLTNYIADFSYGTLASDMESTDWDKYNPYLDSNCDWLSILAYNSYMITPTGTIPPSVQSPNGGNSYTGLFKQGTQGDALFSVREKGYVDEYDISFGGNVEDIVYWGVGIGITDINYKRWAYYSESLANAQVPASTQDNGLTNGTFSFDLDNYKYIYGSGWNLKAGVIIKPVNEIRIGLAVHTPTFYKLKQTYDAINDYVFTPTDTEGIAVGETTKGNEYTEPAYFEWKFNSPWRLMCGIAGVIGNKAIISADYEFAGYNSMNIKVPYGYDDWGGYDFVSDEGVNASISDYFKNQNTVRLGVEYRITPQLSARAGYNVTLTNVKNEAKDGYMEINTSGTDPSYSFNKTTNNISCGLGYRYQSWYIDAAYVYTNRQSTYHAYTNWSGNHAPSVDLKENNSSIVISTGFKF